jgi:ATP-dependent Lon protease
MHLIQNRVNFGGALSGRDTTAVKKTISGLLKLIHPSLSDVPDEDLEWATRIALEVRRRVKEQQKRIGAAEFRNTQFSYSLGEDGIEQYVSTPELKSKNFIGEDPLEPGQAFAFSPGHEDENPALYCVEINEGPGTGKKILNKPVPKPFQESVDFAYQNLCAHAKELIGDKDFRSSELSIQLRAFDEAKSGAKIGMAVLLALCTAVLKKCLRGGLVVVGDINLGGSIDPVLNAAPIVEMASEKGAISLLMPVSCRKQLVDLSDDLATKINILYYSEFREALLKAIED